MAGAGSVAWMFTKKGYILVDKTQSKEEDLLDVVLDAGAEDVKSEDEKNFEIFTQPQDLEKVKAAMLAKNIKFNLAIVTMIPSSTVKLGGQDAKNILALVEDLEGHEDAQNVYANFDIPDEILEQETA